MGIASGYKPTLSEIDGRTFDVIVIGGGIVGAASAREAAREGYSVLLAEKSDFATGATSRSSRLLHCGLRYFETPNPIRTFAMHPGRLRIALRMARQAMMSRHELVTSLPDRLVPIEMMFPIYRHGDYLPWQMDLGFALLSRLAPREVPLNYRRMSREEALAHPMCANLADKENLHSVAVFTEYQFHWPERICIDAVLDARKLGAVALNYTEAHLGALDGEVRRVSLTHRDGAKAEVKGRRVLTMAGLWIDRVLGMADAGVPRKTFGTKGAHIVVRLPDRLRGCGIATINSLGEPFYCIPQDDLHYIGPTETIYEGDPDEVRCDADDISLLIEESRRLFPGFGIRHQDIVRTWAGVRPLTYDESHPKGKRSRELHDLTQDGLPGVFAMTAGPIMTHRDAAREVVAALKRQITPSQPPRHMVYRPRLPLENTNTAPILAGKSPYRLADVRVAVREESARTLSDILYRRTGVGWRHFFTEEELAPVADIMAKELGWTDERRDAEIVSFLEESRRLFSVPGI